MIQPAALVRIAHQLQDADGVGDLLEGVALVVVHPALHDGHRLSPQKPADQPPGVTRGGGGLEMGDIPVGEDDGLFHQVAQEAQAGAQHHGHPGEKAPQPGGDIVGALLIVGEGSIHGNHPF